MQTIVGPRFPEAAGEKFSSRASGNEMVSSRLCETLILQGGCGAGKGHGRIDLVTSGSGEMGFLHCTPVYNEDIISSQQGETFPKWTQDQEGGA